jgi:hypothetical protein
VSGGQGGGPLCMASPGRVRRVDRRDKNRVPLRQMSSRYAKSCHAPPSVTGGRKDGRRRVYIGSRPMAGPGASSSAGCSPTGGEQQALGGCVSRRLCARAGRAHLPSSVGVHICSGAAVAQTHASASLLPPASYPPPALPREPTTAHGSRNPELAGQPAPSPKISYRLSSPAIRHCSRSRSAEPSPWSTASRAARTRNSSCARATATQRRPPWGR